MRQSSSRSQRSKGFRVKHALQIGLLVAVCIWLLYQVKHSHDKKKAFEESNPSISNKIVERQNEVFSLGRKDIPRTVDVTLLSDTRDEEVEEEEEEDEKEIKQEEPEDEGGAEDDEIDEQDRERSDEEEHIELDGEEDKDVRDGEKDFLDDEEEHERASQEAREENYKRDDVASSVHRVTQTTEAEGGNGDARGSHDEQAENSGREEVEMENVANGTVADSEAENVSSVGTMESSQLNVSSNIPTSEIRPDEDLSNMTTDVKRDLELGSPNKEEGSMSNFTADESKNQLELQINLTRSVTENQTETQHNNTVQDTVTNEHQKYGTAGLDLVQYQNSTAESTVPGEVKPKLEDLVTEKANTTSGLAEAEESSTRSLPTNEVDTVAYRETTDPSLHTVTEEERESHIDLSTLPDTQNEEKFVDDEAIE